MITQELVQFIKQQLSLGMTREQISQTLQANGWMIADIQDGFNQVQPIAAPAPTPLPTIQHAPEMMAAMQPVRKSRAGLVVGMIVVILALVAGGAYAYTKLAPTPEKIIAKAIASAASASSFGFSGNIHIHTDGGPNLSSLVSMTGLPAASASSTPAAPDASSGYTGDIRIDGTINLQNSNTELTIADPGDKVNADLRVVAGALYIKPDTTLLPVPNEWISFGGSGTSTLPIPQLTDDQKAARDNFKQSLQTGTAFTVDQVLPDEPSGGIMSHHYKIHINRGAFGTALADYSDQVAGVPIDLWIGTSDGQIHGMSFTAQASAKSISGTVGINILFSNWNTAPDVQAPDNATSFEDVMKTVLSSMMGGGTDPLASLNASELAKAQGRARVAKAESILSEMRPAAELFYASKGSYGTPNMTPGLCGGASGGSMFSDADQFKGLFQQLSTTGALVTCEATQKGWAVGALLPDLTKFCVDSNGYSGTVKSISVVNLGKCK